MVRILQANEEALTALFPQDPAFTRRVIVATQAVTITYENNEQQTCFEISLQANSLVKGRLEITVYDRASPKIIGEGTNLEIVMDFFQVEKTIGKILTTDRFCGLGRTENSSYGVVMHPEFANQVRNAIILSAEPAPTPVPMS